MNYHQPSLLSGSIYKHLIRLTIPLCWGLLAILSFNLVDMYFVAKIGTEELAAISFTFPVVMILINVSLGLGIGTTSVISRELGSGNGSRVKQLTTHTLIMTFFIISAISLFGIFTIAPLFKILGADEYLINYINSYMSIWYLSVPLIAIRMVGNSAIRATGNTLIPSLTMSLAAILNIILDPILIFGLFGVPRFEIQGAALATVIANFIATLLTLLILSKKMHLLGLFIKFREMVTSWKEVLIVAIPAAAGNLITPILNGVTIWILSPYGPDVVAGFGVASRIEAFSVIVIIATGAGLAPIIGQNWGAHFYDRVSKALQISKYFSLLWGLVCTLIFFLIADTLPQIFNDSIEMNKTATIYLKIVPISFGFVGVIFIVQSFFNTIRLAGLAYLTGLSRLLIYLLLLTSPYSGVAGIFIALMLTNFLSGSIAYLYTKNIFKFK